MDWKDTRGWEVKRLKWTIKFIKSGEGIRKEDLSDSGQIEVFGGNGFIGYCDRYNFIGPLFIIGRVGALCGNIHLLFNKCFISDNALVVRVMKTFDQNYYRFLLESININDYASQNAQPLVTGTLIKNIFITCPTKNKQHAIADFLIRETKKIDTLISKIEKQIELLTEYKQALITAAVTGKIDVREKKT